MKYLFFSLIICILLGSSVCCAPMKPTKTPQQQEKELVESLQDKTVALVKSEQEEMYPYCGGVWVARDLILTAFHCIKGGNIVVQYKSFKDKDFEPRYAIPIKFSSESDLLLLQAIEEDIPPHSVAAIASQSWTGEKVHIIGHPNGLWWTYFQGQISAQRRNHNPDLDTYQRLFQISAPVWRGNSGGGAFDYEGNLIGISSWIIVDVPSISFFIHKDAIKEFLVKVDRF